MPIIEEKIENYLNEGNKELNWLAVKLDNGKDYVAIGFKSEKMADNAEDKLNEFDNIKVFSVDFYGQATKKEIKQEYNPVKIFINPKMSEDFMKDIREFLEEKL